MNNRNIYIEVFINAINEHMGGDDYIVDDDLETRKKITKWRDTIEDVKDSYDFIETVKTSYGDLHVFEVGNSEVGSIEMYVLSFGVFSLRLTDC